MGNVLISLNGLVGLGILICYIVVLIKLFKNGQSGWGMMSLIGLIFCGIGLIVAFIGGWLHSKEIEAKQVMVIWTILAVLNFILTGSIFSVVHVHF